MDVVLVQHYLHGKSMACLSMVVLCDPCHWTKSPLLKTDRKVFVQLQFHPEFGQEPAVPLGSSLLCPFPPQHGKRI